MVAPTLIVAKQLVPAGLRVLVLIPAWGQDRESPQAARGSVLRLC